MKSNEIIPAQTTQGLKIVLETSNKLTINQCLTAPIIRVQERLHGHRVAEQIVDEVSLCIEALGLKMTAKQMFLFVGDILDKYQLETMEDIFIVLKNGRQGRHGTTYNSFNMITFTTWMDEHLAVKEDARHQQHEVNKNAGLAPLENVDIYGDFAKKEEAKKPKTDAEFLAEKERQIKEMKDKYFKK